MAGRLEGRVAIVTGAGRGIGRGEALLLAAEGCRVVVNDFGGSARGEGGDSSPADEVAATIKKAGGDALANYGNVASVADGEAMVKQAMERWGRLDILVNNAGILRDRMIFNMSEEDWDAVVSVHLKGHFSVTRPASQVFRQQRSGRIVNTASESGLGNTGQANYSAAKEGIIGLTRTLSLDLGRYGVTVNAIRPRAATRLTQSPEMEAARARRETEAAARGEALPERPSAAARGPEGIAPFIVFLCTDAASAVNGRDFMVSNTDIALYSLPEQVRTIHSDAGWDVALIERLFPQTLGKGLQPVMPQTG